MWRFMENCENFGEKKSFKGLEKRPRNIFSGCCYIEIIRFSMYANIFWQNPCKLPMRFRCIKAYMLAFSERFSRKCLEGISFNFFVCFILNVSIGSAPKRKNFDIQRNTRVGSGGQFTSNRLSCHQVQIQTWIKVSTPSNFHAHITLAKLVFIACLRK